jgi:tRNA nucleotidyltransferase (CCA-adding enzyme)
VEGIKATWENQQVIERAVANRSQISSIVEVAQGKPRRSEIGTAIRRLDTHANTRKSQVLYSTLRDLYEYDGISVIQRYNASAEYVRHEDLADVSAHTPIVNGKKMAEGLQMKTGPWMKGALDLVMAW